MAVTTYKPPALFKHTEKGLQVWQIWVESDGPEKGDIRIEYGLVTGKKVPKIDTVTKGKNVGRKNATTPAQQAVLEAEAQWRKKIERECYDEDPTGKQSYLKRLRAPMLAQTYNDKAAEKVTWDRAWVQPKFDGHRNIARRGNIVTEMTSRKFLPVTTLVHIEAELRDLLKTGQALDGEIYLHGYTVHEIGGAIAATNELTPKLEYHVYDSPVLEWDFSQRLAFLRSLFDGRQLQFVKLVPTYEVKSKEEAWRYEKEFIGQDFEGAMLRYGGDTYAASERSASLLKLKEWKDAEFKILSVTEGRGTMAGMAIFGLETEAGHPFDVLAGGTHAQKQEAWVNREQWIGKVITVEYAYYTETETPVPWHPRVKKGTTVDDDE